MDLYFDLDGVLRIFGPYVFGGYEPTSWYHKHNGKTVIEIVNEHPDICSYAPESEYLPAVNAMLDSIEILTNQLPSWIPYTEMWLEKHIKIPYEVTYTKNPADKLSYLPQGSILVEDFPGFSSYDNIALITRNYNKKMDVPLRISSVSEFEAFLRDHA